MARLSATFSVGSLEVVALSDGVTRRQVGAFFQDVAEAEWTRAVGLTNSTDPMPINFGSFLIRGTDRLTLIDSGWGAEMLAEDVEGASGLLERLREIGVEPGAIEAIVHTHLHGDHCGWDVKGKDGTALTFPNATIHVSQTELDYWLGADTDTSDKSPYIRSRIVPVQAAGHLRTFTGEHAVSPHVTLIPTPGHTPGHCSVMLASGGEHLLITGDAAHHPAHLEHPDWIPAFDLDRAEAARSRQKLIALAADQDVTVTGGHFPILTLGKVERTDAGYRWRQL